MLRTDVKDLIERYFDGKTTCKEERVLRRLFTTDRIPEEYAVYRPLFACIAEERKQGSTHRRQMRRLYIWSVSTAAIILIIFGTGSYYNYQRKAETNYMIVNGKKYTDVHMAQQQALQAFKEVSFSQEDIANDIISNDIKEDEE